ncbi:MAG: hypothetical protein VZR00_06075 [Lachnospiraceae bacterium]|jgi:hypothetical protein|nr:hypothetical protein [Lachnospiraceae bacterium]MEE3461444.1 hypothetical protein [Lachnospiraceae bacterium]
MKRKIIFSVLVFAILLVTITFKDRSSKLNVNQVFTSYTIDVDNPEEVVKAADNVFVGTVISCDSVRYINDQAVTNYTVKVKSNIKNNLKTDKTITIGKWGGVDKDLKSFQLIEDDVMPVPGNTYVFMANKQNDGTLLVSGKNSNIEITEAADTDSIKASKVYKIYEDAEKNESGNSDN